MRCAVYVRVSTNKEEQKASLKYQKELFYKYIEKKGWEIYEFYVDVQSGTTGKREKLQKMIQDAEDKKFDIILAKELSRLARNGELSYRIKNLCEHKGIHIITLDNAINTLKGDTHMFGLYAWMYEQESQNTSNRVKASLRTRAEKGLFRGSIPPYGYDLREGKLFIKQDNTPNIVKRIFNEYLDGSGHDSIARRLYNEGIPTPADVAGKKNAGETWNGSTIRLILTNPHYVGDLVQGRETSISVTNKRRKKVDKSEQIILKDKHEPIISRADFKVAQQQLEIRSKIIPAPKKHLFTNLLFCADCGIGMWYRSNQNGYICGRYARYGKKACSNHAVKEEFLKDTILCDIKGLVEKIDKEEYVKQLELRSKKSKSNLESQINNINHQIDGLKKRNRKFINLLADELISPKDYRENVDVNKGEINALVNEKNELLTLLESEQVIVNIDKLKDELLSFLNFDELTSEILHRLIKKVEVNNDRSFKIHYRFSAPKFE